MTPRVAIFNRVKLGGKRKYVRAKTDSRGRLKAGNGDFIFRFTAADHKQTFERVGSDPAETLRRQAAIIALGLLGKPPGVARKQKPESDPENSGRLTIRKAAEDYMDSLHLDVSNGEKSWSTVYLYCRTIKQFLALATASGKTFMDEIDERILLDFKQWCFKNLKKNQIGEQTTTVANRFRYLNVWLHRYGIQMAKQKNAPILGAAGLMQFRDVPMKKRKLADKYSEDQIAKMLAVADTDEADLIQFFLFTGFRDEEVAHTEWSDFNWNQGTINIHCKPGWKSVRCPKGWQTKNSKPREIDLPMTQAFMERMRARRERSYKDVELVFPVLEARKLDMNLLKRVRIVFDRAELPGRCSLHRFRRTCGTAITNEFGLETARLWLGHSDLKTTGGYIAAEQIYSREGFSPEPVS